MAQWMSQSGLHLTLSFSLFSWTNKTTFYQIISLLFLFVLIKSRASYLVVFSFQCVFRLPIWRKRFYLVVWTTLSKLRICISSKYFSLSWRKIEYQITFTHCERNESRSKWCPCLCGVSHQYKFPSSASRTERLVRARSFRIHEKAAVTYRISKQLFLFITPSIYTYPVTMSMCYKVNFHDWMKTSSGSNMESTFSVEYV